MEWENGNISLADAYLIYVIKQAAVAELADAPDLGSGGRPCRFDSCQPHEREMVGSLVLSRLSTFLIYRVVYVLVCTCHFRHSAIKSIGISFLITLRI